jgi:hypothetical protein
MFAEYPAPDRAEICQVLEWLEAHPDGYWKDMGGLKALYDKWRQVICVGDRPLVIPHSWTQWTVPRLSPHGRFFLTRQRADQAGGSGPAGDRGDDPGSVRRPAPVCRLAVTDRCLTLDGQVVRLPHVTSERQAAVLAFIADLIEHPNARRTGLEIAEAAAAKDVITGRVDRLKGLLPPPVKSLIESNSRGYILAAAAWRGLA